MELPKEPTPGLLMSMVLRYDHALGNPGHYDNQPIQFGATHQQRLEAALSLMRQVYQEVSGNGFYHPILEPQYAAKLTRQTSLKS